MIPVLVSKVIPAGRVSDIDRTLVPVPRVAENAVVERAIP